MSSLPESSTTTDSGTNETSAEPTEPQPGPSQDLNDDPKPGKNQCFQICSVEEPFTKNMVFQVPVRHQLISI